METNELIQERGKTHGDYAHHAQATQTIKACIQNFHGETTPTGQPIRPYFSRLDHCQRETLDMIAHKIGRILAGDPDFRDHWDDIAGYAKLVANRCSK